MDQHNHSALRIGSRHYRTADLIIAAAFLLAAIVGGYFAIAHQVRDYWALLVVGVVGAVLLLRRARSGPAAG